MGCPVIAMTGATGFVGSHVLDLATSRQVSVRALTRRPQPDRSGIEWVQGDLHDLAALDRLCDGADSVLHIAGVVNAPTREGFRKGNPEGTANVVAAADRAGVGRLVHVSSLAAREPDISDYCWSKAEAEKPVRSSRLNWTIVRPPAIYGPRDTEMFEVFRAARTRIVPMPPKGHISIIHVGDLARLLFGLACTARYSGDVYEVDDGKPGGWTHVEFGKALGLAFGHSVLAFRVPAAMLRLGARLDLLFRGGKAKLTPDRANYMLHDDWVARPDPRPDPEFWVPRKDGATGLKETAGWYLASGWL